MVNYYKDALYSIDSIQNIVKGTTNTPLQLNERQCQFLAQELAETKVFLENGRDRLKFGQDIRYIALHLCSAIKKAELLVKKCCCKDSESWLVAAMKLVEIQEEFAAILLDIYLWRLYLDIAIDSAGRLSHKEKVEKLMNMEEKYHRSFKKLRRENHVLKQAAIEDKKIILLRIAGMIVDHDMDLEYVQAIYLQSWLSHSEVEARNAASTVLKLNKYKDVHVLGKGACGTVFEVTWLGVRCALKILNVQDEREATVLKGLYHPNIIRLFHYWEAPPHNPKSHLVMELMPTDLGAYIEGRLKSVPSSSCPTGKENMPFSLPVAIDVMLQLAQAMLYLHDRRLTHRDLKPSNILVKERESLGLSSLDGAGYLDIKLADFGLVKAYGNTSTTQGHTVNTGTAIYGAPEIFGKDLNLERNFLPMADVWSFGITCAEILSGEMPFRDEPKMTLHTRIFKEGLRPTLPKHCPQYVTFCISSCWELLPERRPNFASICRLLRHAKLLSLGLTDLDDSKLFFAYSTRSGYVKTLCKSPTSMADRFSTLFQTSFKNYLGLGGQSTPEIEMDGNESETSISSSSTTTNTTTSLGLKSLNRDEDVAKGQAEDPDLAVHRTGLHPEIHNTSAQGILRVKISIPTKVEERLSASKWELAHTFTMHSGPVHGIAVNLSGNLVATASWDHLCRVYDVHLEEEVAVLAGHLLGLYAVKFSLAKRDLVGTVSSDQTCRLWNTDTGECLRVLEGHTDEVNGLSFNPGTHLLATASDDATSMIWDAEKGISVTTLRGHRHGVYGVCFQPNGGHLLATASFDFTAKLWDSRSAEAVQDFRGHLDDVIGVDIDESETYLATGSDDKTCRIWDLRVPGRQVFILQANSGEVKRVVFSPYGRLLATTSSDTRVRIFNTQTWDHVDTLSSHSDHVFDVAWSPTANFLVTASHDKKWTLWQPNCGKGSQNP